MSVERAEVGHGEAKGTGKLFLYFFWLNVAADFNFL